MDRIAILAGGPEALQPLIGSSKYDDCTWLGVDRGTYYLLRKGRIPARAFGDFDSLSETEKEWVFAQPLSLSAYPREKDKTDLEIAIDWALAKRPDECLVFGATGGRLDHGLINIQLLLKGVGTGTRLQIIDKKNVVTLLTPGAYHVTRTREFPYLSFVAFTEKVRGITLKGLKYPLFDRDLPMGSTLCISNEIEAKIGEVSFSEGLLLMIQSSD